MQRAEMASDDGGEQSATTPPLKQVTLGTSAITQRKVNSLVLEFIIADMQPFSLVEKATFPKMIEGISGGRTTMCRKTLMEGVKWMMRCSRIAQMMQFADVSAVL